MQYSQKKTSRTTERAKNSLVTGGFQARGGSIRNNLCSFAQITAIRKRQSMITKNEIKSVRALSLKKYRDEAELFTAEGRKVIDDLLPLVTCRRLYATNEYAAAVSLPAKAVTIVSEDELHKLSSLKTPRAGIALFEKPKRSITPERLRDITRNELCLALDGVQDPGNLGTIIRIADWFGIRHIVASKDTADVFSPKVVQATMGAIGRVAVYYTDLPDLLTPLINDTPIYGTFLNGESIYRERLTDNGIIIMGNEGNGITPGVSEIVNRRLLIPNYPVGRATSESLNVAVATAIVCSEFRRSNVIHQ